MSVTPPSPQFMPANIWLIEDNPADIFLSRMLLEDEHVALLLHPLEGGDAAMRAIGRLSSHPFPDAILLNINMPGISGITVLKTIRRHTLLSRVPVFILSGSPYECERNSARDMGTTGYIQKPLSRCKIIAMTASCPLLRADIQGGICHITRTEYPAAVTKTRPSVLPEPLSAV